MAATKKELIQAFRLEGMTKDEVIKYFLSLLKRRENKIAILWSRVLEAEKQVKMLNNQTLIKDNEELLEEIVRLGEGNLAVENAELHECNRRLSDEINNLHRRIKIMTPAYPLPPKL